MDHRFLVAVPDETTRNSTDEQLRHLGVTALLADDILRAEQLCRDEHPSAALIADALGQGRGGELCRRLKRQIDPALPVVLLFTEGERNTHSRSNAASADNFLVLPASAAELAFCVRSLLRLRALLKRPPAPPPPRGDAETDDEQGLVSGEMFYSFLELELRRVDRYGFPLSVLSVAVDPLPEDSGSWASLLDKQLGPVLASAVRRTLRDIDLCTAVRPREYLVLMPHTDQAGAQKVGRRICSTIASQAYQFGRSRIEPTVSVGVCCVHGDPVEPAELLVTANAIRAEAAAAGGNRVVLRDA